MPQLHVQVPGAAERLETGFTRIRDELSIPRDFPEDIAAAALAAAARGAKLPPGAHAESGDHRHVPMLTIDPPGSRDLDQAFGARRAGSGYRVYYAIADVAAFVAPGDPIDSEARSRGVTLYSPDRRTPLHPEVLSEGAASLLPDADRNALLWTLDLDPRGELSGAHLMRSRVRSRRALSYAAVQEALDRGTASETLRLLREVGTLRQERERERGGVSLNLPTQEVVHQGNHYALRFEAALPVEGWNAQISLLAGVAAAQIMLNAGVGLLRTLPEPDAQTLEELGLCARALGIPWAESTSYPEFVRSLDPVLPTHAAMMTQAARAFRGAGYVAFDGELPKHPEHSALASTYAHVTAPLRRLCDRFTNEVVLAACAGRRPPGWVLEALPTLPSIMGTAGRRARSLERAIVDFVEAMVLAPRVGETFDALVTHVQGGRTSVQLRDPAVRARLDGRNARLGEELPVRLVEADADRRRVRFQRG